MNWRSGFFLNYDNGKLSYIDLSNLQYIFGIGFAKYNEWKFCQILFSKLSDVAPTCICASNVDNFGSIFLVALF